MVNIFPDVVFPDNIVDKNFKPSPSAVVLEHGSIHTVPIPGIMS
jgi:hypothetical protein